MDNFWCKDGQRLAATSDFPKNPVVHKPFVSADQLSKGGYNPKEFGSSSSMINSSSRNMFANFANGNNSDER